MDTEARVKIARFYRKHRRMPTYAEIMGIMGYASKNAVYRLTERLIRERVLEKDPKGRLIPRALYGDAKLLGTVEAGFPTAAEEELADAMNFDEYLIGNKEATYILKVKGDSMQDAGIREGDLVIVERGKTPKNGDIVIAEVDHEWTMKYYHKKGNVVRLVAANPKYKPIIPQEELKIEAIVQAVVRKYA